MSPCNFGRVRAGCVFFQEVFLLIAHYLARLGAHNGIAPVSLTCLVPDEGVQ
jgi:hypothetical protein